MRVAFIILIFTIIFAKFLALTLFFSYETSLVLSLVLFILLLALILYFGDKWIISQLGGNSQNIPSYIHRLGENLKYKMNMIDVHFYLSSDYSKNIYFFQTMNHKPVIVIGRDVSNFLSKEEIEALLFLFFNLVDRRKVKNHTWFNFLMFFFEWPNFLLKHLGFNENNWLVRFVSFYFFPFNYFRFVVVEKDFRRTMNLISDEIKSQYGLNIYSLIFKINKMHTSDIMGRLKTNDFFDNFALVPCQHIGVFNKLVFKDYDC